MDPGKLPTIQEENEFEDSETSGNSAGLAQEVEKLRRDNSTLEEMIEKLMQEVALR